ncbi:hypothetical protein MNBD_ALPHA07-2076 [hydrothermal vent metagenome]|uniref:Nucleoside-binding outer membrane protein n=1 Tax=hydrothermal vent metagenome TaxID=652676 RepID=A0A3B0RGY9_9ZZZZ
MLKQFRNLCAGLALAGGLAIGAPAFAGFSTTEVQLHYGDNYKFGANSTFGGGFAEETARETITIEHFSAGKYGTLFFFVDFFRDDEARAPGNNKAGQYGEIYGFLSAKTLGLSFSENSFIKDVGIEAGINEGTDFLVGLIGPKVEFNVPGVQVLTFALYAYDNWVDPVAGRNPDLTYQATIVWGIPFDIGTQKFRFQGFVDFIGSQSNGGFQIADQIVFSPQIRWDIGNAFGGAENRFTLGIEYTHFQNKFGATTADENSASIFVAMRF